MADTKTMKVNNAEKQGFLVRPIGSIVGFIYTLIIGFGLYFVLNSFKNVGNWFPYSKVVEKAGEGDILYKFVWFLMNFTEAQFYAGVLASLGIILGGLVAWRLSLKRSKFAGFEICYGSANMWPWVFASQVISLGIAIFVLNFTNFFSSGEYTWLPTFITVVGVPPSMMLMYGPSYRALFTSSILGGTLSFPVAFWIMTNIMPVLEVPGVVSNVLTMAITGIIIGQICKVLPWMKKKPVKAIEGTKVSVSKEEQLSQMSKPSWFVRRVLADFSEAQFYGNEVAGIFVIIGVSLEWLINSGHGAYAAGVIPAIILSQFIGAGIGVLLYFNKYFESGWYATYVPVVSVGPACVLMFGGSLSVAIVAGLLGGILGGPIAEYFASKLPDHIHPTVANVTSMALSTIVVSVVIKALPWL
ncbi:hypothetical protein [Brassicibacter mesophilus]|uniref:hypothetical protein n=1 Tax=Brassicibacter mesophilus TaxID=745119 RepID=UPI003D1C79D8